MLTFGGFHYENPVQSILDFEKFESCPKAVAIVCQPSFPWKEGKNNECSSSEVIDLGVVGIEQTMGTLKDNSPKTPRLSH